MTYLVGHSNQFIPKEFCKTFPTNPSKARYYIVICRFICSERWSDLENARSHNRHWNGRSPVCLRVWRVNSSLRANFHPQPFQLHTYGFSPVCVLWWAFRWLDLVYVLVQPSCGQWWIICLRLDHVRLFLGLAILPSRGGQNENKYIIWILKKLITA